MLSERSAQRGRQRRGWPRSAPALGYRPRCPPARRPRLGCNEPADCGALRLQTPDRRDLSLRLRCNCKRQPPSPVRRRRALRLALARRDRVPEPLEGPNVAPARLFATYLALRCARNVPRSGAHAQRTLAPSVGRVSARLWLE
eukprot:scaffold101023_cov66-Phaeocystis_antarctica.AAC.2